MKAIRAAGILFFIFILCAAPLLRAQTNEDAAERARAIQLFNENKYLEALPLFEDLSAKRPQDTQIMLGLAASLVSKAATLEDDTAAAKLRVRARKLLQQAKELGLKDSLMENLLELLPENGIIHYSSSPADQAMRAAEAAFGSGDYDQAIVQYKKVLQYQPKNYEAVLYVGDSYFAKKDFANAAIWYEKATQTDPNRETAWRYWSDMAAKNGDFAKGRELAIQGVIAEPYNNIPWRGLQQWATLAKVQLAKIKINPRTSVSSTGEKNITISVDPKQNAGHNGAAWFGYAGTRALWRGDKFLKEFPNEKQYRHSLKEEVEALTSVAKIWLELTESDEKEHKAAEAPDADMAMLLKLYRAGMLEPYILLSAPDQGIAQDYAAYREKNREKLAQYLSDFIAPLPLPAAPAAAK